MGCDIHIFTELYDAYTKRWENIDDWRVYIGEDYGAPKMRPVEVWEGRFYVLFGKLTGHVRYYDPHPISDTKGLPKDISEQTKEWWNWGKDDWHNASWLTLAELQNYLDNAPSGKKIDDKCKDCFYMKQYMEDYDEYIEERCVKENIKSMVDGILDRARKHFPYMYDDAFKEYIEKNSDKIRIVFWFDS